jgi:hypothetical protein
LTLTHAELHREIRTTLARLSLISEASTQSFDSNGGRSCENPGGKRPPGSSKTADVWYRDRLTDLDAGHGRRVPKERGSNVKVRDTYERLLGDARDELAQVTGRTEKAPERKGHKMDTKQGVQDAAFEDAPGKPADVIARQFGVTVFTARRWYVGWALDPRDGSVVGGEAEDEASLIVRAQEMARRGMTQKQIGKVLAKSQPTVSRYLRAA